MTTFLSVSGRSSQAGHLRDRVPHPGSAGFSYSSSATCGPFWGEQRPLRLSACAGHGGYVIHAGNRLTGRVAAETTALYGFHSLRFGGAFPFFLVAGRPRYVEAGPGIVTPPPNARCRGRAFIQSDARHLGEGRHWPERSERPGGVE